MFYNFNQGDATGLVLPGAPATVAQYELYANGEKGTYFIDTAKSVKKSTDGVAAGAAWSATTDIEKDTFYTERGAPRRICAAVNKEKACWRKTICVKKYCCERLRIAPVLPKRRPVGGNKKRCV